MKLTWPALALSALLLTGCATVPSASAPKPNIRQIFLNYVPPNEPGAPHDMEWIVEHFAGDGGYYGTKYFPGTLKVKEYSNTDIEHYLTINSKKTTSITYTLNNVLWEVAWTIGSQKFVFDIYQTPKQKRWTSLPINQMAVVATLSFGNPNG